KNVKFNHFDFYRFEDPEEFDDAGFRESFGPGQITATEWTDKAVPFVPKEDLKIIFYFQDAGRNVDLISSSNLGDQILTKMSELR
ncbi:MAG: tRNA (adenosine(37)-N6)-threonylcarbamoyltransferase complex ATPase subunit type 1 TsaE, partial [Burkholderiaceae bacterium]|nr:tRNA (adenosine(37)-N6)-threonylcarbamoyltransferase complex ATPase subunit type 1 TsaE [Burkholderiaceae bacterium]